MTKKMLYKIIFRTAGDILLSGFNLQEKIFFLIKTLQFRNITVTLNQLMI